MRIQDNGLVWMVTEPGLDELLMICSRSSNPWRKLLDLSMNSGSVRQRIDYTEQANDSRQYSVFYVLLL